MASFTDEQFAQAVLTRGLTTSNLVEECLQHLQQAREGGVSKSLPEVLVERGVLTPAQVEEVGNTLSTPAVEGPAAALPPAAATATATDKGQKLQQLGRYQIVERLGAGGMGTVFKALDVPLGRTVALKVLAPRLVSNPQYVERFMREARSAAALNHPNIVGALDVGQEGKYFYFAMEFVEGTTIQRRLKTQGRIPEAEALDLILQVAHALEHAASKSIIHRDIKPDNIMVTPQGQAKLTDLGLAKSIESGQTTITQAGKMLGTPHYASPEQIRGELTIDTRTDIYSLGMTLYHMVVGSPAFDGPSAGVISAKHLSEPFPNPKTACPDLSDGLCRILQKMTQKKPEGRYQTATDLVEDLEHVRKGEPPAHAGSGLPLLVRKGPAAEPRAMATPAAKTSPGPKVIAAAVALIALSAGSYLLLKKSGSTGTGTPPSPVTTTSAEGEARPAQTSTSASAPPQPAPPPPLPEKPAEDLPQKAAKTALEEARKFAEKNPEELATLRSLYAEVLKFPDTPEYAAAQEQTQALEKKVQAAFEAVEKQVLDSLAQENYPAAEKALASFPEGYAFDAWEQRHQSLSQQMNESAQRAWDRLHALGLEALKGKQFADARKIYQDSLGRLPAGFQDAAKKNMAEIDEREIDEQERRKKDRVTLYQKFLKDNAARLKERRYAEAEEAAQKALQAAEYDALRADLEFELELAQMLKKILKLAEEGAKGREKKPYRYKAYSGKLSKVENGRLIIEIGPEAEVGISIQKQLDTEAVLGLAKPLIEKDPLGPVLLGAFYLAEGDTKRAEENWKAAAKAGLDIERGLKKLEFAGQNEKEFEAQNLITNVRSKFERKRWEEVVKLVAELQKNYAETAAVVQAQKDLEQLLEEARARQEEEEEKMASKSSRGGGKFSGKDGYEQYTSWQVLPWPTGSGSAAVNFGTLKKESDTNRVIRFTYQNVDPKIFLGMEGKYDLSKRKRLFMRVHNLSKAKAKMSLALRTGNLFTYYESPIEFEIDGGALGEHYFKLARPTFKCDASNWEYRAKIDGLEDVRTIIFLVHPEKPEGELVFETVDLAD